MLSNPEEREQRKKHFGGQDIFLEKKGKENKRIEPDGGFGLPAALLILIQPKHLPVSDVDAGLGDDSAGVGNEPIDGPTQPLRFDADVYHLLPVLQASG